MAFNAGDIEARLTLDRDPFQRSLRAAREEAERFERDEIEPQLDLRTTGFFTAIRSARNELGRFDRQTATATIGVRGTPQAMGQVEALAQRVRQFGRMRETAHLRVEVDRSGLRGGLSSLATDLNRTRQAMAGLGNQARRTEVDVDRTHGGFRRFLGVLGAIPMATAHVISDAIGLGRAFATISARMGAVTAGMGLLARVASFAAVGMGVLGAAFTLVSAVITPIVSGLGAMVLSLGAGAAGFGALGIAAGGAGAAIGALAFGAVARFKEQANTAGTAANRLQRAMQGVQRAFQFATRLGADRMFRGLADLLRGIQPQVRALRGAFTALGTSLGRAFRGVQPQVQSLLRSFRGLIMQSRGLSGPIVRGFVALGRVLTNIARAAMPTLVRLARSAAQTFERWARNTSNMNRLRSGIQTIVHHLRQWWRIGENVLKTVIAIFKGGEQPIRRFVTWLADGAQKLREWAESRRGQEQIKQFFEDTLPTVKEIVKFIGNLVTSGLKIGQDLAPGVKVFVQAMNALVDVIEAAVDAMTRLRDAAGWVMGGGPGRAGVGLGARVRGSLFGGGGGGDYVGHPRQHGGPIPGTGAIPFLGHGGEHVLTAAEVRAAGGHAGVFAMRQMLTGAGGGALAAMAGGGGVALGGDPAVALLARILEAIRQLPRQLVRGLGGRRGRGRSGGRGGGAGGGGGRGAGRDRGREPEVPETLEPLRTDRDAEDPEGFFDRYAIRGAQVALADARSWLRYHQIGAGRQPSRQARQQIARAERNLRRQRRRVRAARLNAERMAEQREREREEAERRREEAMRGPFDQEEGELYAEDLEWASARSRMDALVGRMGGLGELGPTGGPRTGPQIIVNTLHPGDPRTLAAIGRAATQGISAQSRRPPIRTRVM